MRFRIFTDSAADLTPEEIEELGVSVVHQHSTVTYPDGRVADGNAMDYPAFYHAIRDEKAIPTTSAYNIGDVTSAIEPVLAAGEDVLFLTFSSKLSTGYNVARLAADDLTEKYPGRKVIVVDTLSASRGQGLLVYHIVKFAEGGRTLEETAGYAERTRLSLVHWFTVDDLAFLKRGGRISGVKAAIGTMLNIKPVLHVDNEGRLIDVERAKGRKNAIRALFEHMKKTVIVPDGQLFYICQGDCMADAEMLRDMVLAEYPNSSVHIGYTGHGVGSHSGPGTLALFFLGSQR